jgi:hypothetical protein
MGDDENEEEENILNMEALNKMNNITNNKVFAFCKIKLLIIINTKTAI